ncbi:MAG TPA: type II toxin-antitoxin system VapC family toxin [Gaiellaceae bacterium]|nr:type II toxin-antitoxin system VapC family toxin [Gaiellaceae bacterium]
MIVLDSSAVLDYLLREPILADWVESQLDIASWNLHAPYAVDLEVFAVVRGRVLGRSMTAGRGRAILDVFVGMPIRRYPHVQLFDRMWALRAHVSPRDAGFVALAEALDVPLVTTDTRLSRAHGFATTIVAP